MRILLHDYAGHPFQIQVSRELARRGHAVLHGYAGGLVTPRGELRRREGDPPGLAFHEFPMPPEYPRLKLRFVRRHRLEAAYGRRLRAFADGWKPDLVISANTPSGPQLQLASHCRNHGIPFVAWVQDVYGVAVHALARRVSPVLGRLAGAWYISMDRRALRMSAAAIAITPDFLPFLRSSGLREERIHVIPNWAPVDDLPQMPRRNPWSEAHGLGDGINLIYTGTLAMKHNPGLLLGLAESLRSTPDVRVVVVTEGSGGQWLEQQSRARHLANLRLLPYQAFEDMPSVLGSADILLAVLDPEAGSVSVPSKVLSYLCAGRPVLAAIPAANAAARLLTHTGAGVCVEPDDATGFQREAARLVRDPEERRRLGSNGRRHAEQEFPIDAVMARFDPVLDQVMGPGTSRR